MAAQAKQTLMSSSEGVADGDKCGVCGAHGDGLIPHGSLMACDKKSCDLAFCTECAK
eukprot:COSAG02_NODE_43516_length_374_cov_0.567273_1_plen_56_part_10